MIARREWYARTRAEWPAVVPVPTPEEAIAGARKLYRFATGHTWRGPVKVTSGNRYSGIGYDRIKGSALYVNATASRDGGPWQTIVHELSHGLARLAGIEGAHSKEHARLEARMIREVIRRGWLGGALLPKPKPEKPAPDPRTLRLARVDQLIKQWETKAKRAATALKKLSKERARIRLRIGLH